MISRHPLTLTGVLVLILQFHFLPRVFSFRQVSHKVLKPLFPRLLHAATQGSKSAVTFPNPQEGTIMSNIKPTLADNTRTITHICKSGTLSTVSDEGDPIGTSVDFVLNPKGHPIFFFSKKATSLSNDARASFFCKIPLEYEHTSSLSSKSASIQGELVPVSKKEVNSLKIAFSLTHPHCTDHLCQSDDIFFAKLQPTSILYSTGDFGAKPIPINIQDYEAAFPDILAQEVPTLLPHLNIAKQYELRLFCKHILNIPEDVQTVTLQSIDKLGIDIRTTRSEWLGWRHLSFIGIYVFYIFHITDLFISYILYPIDYIFITLIIIFILFSLSLDDIREDYRVVFRHAITSAEDAKSEVIKLFQECYMREQGRGEGFYPPHPPVVIKYA